ncbi:hypothetical protein ACFWFZ_02270 [Streptomyces sp. NPDC060232]|uniref:hypothetical protein n=1 Tax=Streptomyces sp. NPDC060232 TaxID=3347079 RepID=UPI00365A665D
MSRGTRRPATAGPDDTFRIRPWLAPAAERTRPLADVEHDHDGASPIALPTADPATRLTLPAPRRSP